MGDYILGVELGKLRGLGVDPPEGFEVFEVVVRGQEGGEFDKGVGAPLGNHGDATDFFDHGIAWGGYTVEVAGDLGTKVGNADEFFEDVFRHYIGVAVFFDTFRRDVEVVGTEVKVGGGDGTHAPVCFGGKGFLFVGTGSGNDQFVTVYVCGFRGDRL